MNADPSFTIGIEEEYLLVERESRDLAAEPPPEMLAECEARLSGRVMPEFLQSQIEVATGICTSLAQARSELAGLRAGVAAVADRHGLAPIAAGTHPFALWTRQKTTALERYHGIDRDMAAVARRLVICGLHVHVGIEDDDLRIDLMNQVSYFLPHLLALSTSSPFWQGQETGLMSYRLSIFDSLPRTGLPDRFESFGEYQRLVRRLIKAGLIDDAGKLWWDVRPSARFPTLEMRITDVCTRLEDAITIAALFRSLLAMLYRLKQRNQRWRLYANALVQENRWLAQRHGSDGALADFGKGARFPFPDLLEELIELAREEAVAFGCWPEVLKARDILARGTSAHRQIALYRAAQAEGASPEAALRQVVDWLIAETQAGCSPA